MRRAVVRAVVCGMMALPGTAGAVDTQIWISDSPADYAKAESEGVVVSPEGVLSLGPRSASSPAESLTVIWALAAMADGSVALAGDGGRVDRWTESGGVRPWVRLPVGQVLALASDGDGLVAGTGPDGVIYRIGAKGDTALVARTGERYVWGLATAGKGAWWAASGTRGRLLKIEGGKSRIVLDTEESNLVSIASDGRGGCWAGGDSKGRVVHVSASGQASTTYDAAEDEVRALALGADGALYAAALTASATATGGEDDEMVVRPQPVRSAVSGGRATVYRIVPDSSSAAHWVSPHPFVFALAATQDGMVAATGNRAALFLLGRGGIASQWLSAPQGQVTAVATDRRGRLFAATSNPGALWRVGPERADRGELSSSVHDARRFARFGKVRWRGDAGGGRVEIETRSGNTDPPDTTWSRWRKAGGEDRAAAARYFQWKIELAGGNPRVDAVEVAWRERNLGPRVEEVTVAPQGIGFREGDLQPRTEPVTQTLPGGQRVEYSISTGGAKALEELPMWARGLRTLQWRGSDPNGDPLTYQVDLRSEGANHWTSVGKDLETTSFTWDTRGVPDGRYRIRVSASDAAANALGEELEANASSEPFTVDNTEPQITRFDLSGESRAVVVTGAAEDGQSILVRVDVSVDDAEWREVSPEGGLAEERSMSFRARLPNLEPGEHLVAVRVVDQAGNGATRAGRVTVPRAR